MSIGENLELHQRGNESDLNFKIRIPFDISVTKGERLFVLGSNQSGKSSFFQSVLGNLVCERGVLGVGGRLGYVPQVAFVRRDTLRNNITFGEVEDSAKLNRAEDFVDMASELNDLQKYDSAELPDISVVASPDFRHKISFARALYYDADVFLIDDVFADMNISSVRKLLSNFERLEPGRTLLISTELTSVIRPNDRVLIIDRGIAVEYGIFSTMLEQPNSFVHYFVQSERAALGMRQVTPTKSNSFHTHNRLIKERKIAVANRFPIRTTVSSSAFYRYTHENNMAAHGSSPGKAKRWEGVPLRHFGFFIKAGQIKLFILFGTVELNSVILIAVGQSLNLLSVWWIGSARETFPHLSNDLIVGIYVVLVCGYGFLSLSGCILITSMSISATEKVATSIS